MNQFHNIGHLNRQPQILYYKEDFRESNRDPILAQYVKRQFQDFSLKCYLNFYNRPEASEPNTKYFMAASEPRPESRLKATNA